MQDSFDLVAAFFLRSKGKGLRRIRLSGAESIPPSNAGWQILHHPEAE